MHKMDKMDILLYAAMPYVKNRELEKYNSVEDTTPPILSERVTKKIYKRIMREKRYRERHENYSYAVELSKRIAVILLAIMSACFVSIISVGSVREVLRDSAVEWYENSIWFKYVGDDPVVPSVILEYKEPKLGDEFERFEVYKNESDFYIEYESEHHLVMYQQRLLSEYEVLLSNNDTEMEEVTINGYVGYTTTYLSNDITMITLIWTDNTCVYKISSDIPMDKLIEIAESIE